MSTFDLIKDNRLVAALEKLRVRPTAISLADAMIEDMPLVYVNDAFERMTGYFADEVIGQNCRFLQGEGTDRNVVDRIRTALNAGTEGAYCLLNHRRDGTPFHNLLMITPLNTVRGGRYILGCQYEIRPSMLNPNLTDHVTSVQGVVGQLVHDGGLLDEVYWRSFHMRSEAIRLSVDGYLLSINAKGRA